MKLKGDSQDITILMSALKPGQFARIMSTDSPYNGHLVMRTLSSKNYEVMDLTVSSANSCWSDSTALPVIPLPVGTQVTLEQTE